MNMITKKEIEKLASVEANYCSSLYLPTIQFGSETQQNPIRLKNLVQNAAAQLEKTAWSPPDIKQYLSPVRDLVENHEFWENQREGLALFLDPDDLFQYRLPIEFQETLAVSNRFHLKPLFPLVDQENDFFILAISLRNVRLYKGNNYHVGEIDDIDLPKGIEEALGYDDPEKQLQHQTLSRTGSGHPAIHHGHGDDYDQKENIQRYLQMVDHSVNRYFKDKRTPLVLAGVDYILSIYREVNSYDHLIEEGVSGNPESLPSDQLHRKAWEAVKPIIQDNHSTALERYLYLYSSENDKTANQVQEVLPAAYFGRIESLFVAIDQNQWGVFNPETNTTDLHQEMNPDNHDLLDLAAIYTYQNGGSVYAVKSEKIPGEAGLAAILRY
jgi:hypothetical protein